METITKRELLKEKTILPKNENSKSTTNKKS